MNTRFNRFIALALVSTLVNISAAQAANDFNDEKTAKAFEMYCATITETSNAARRKQSQPERKDVCAAEHGQRDSLIAKFKALCSTPDMCLAKAVYMTEGNSLSPRIEELKTPKQGESAEAKAARTAELKDLQDAFDGLDKIYKSITPENAVASLNMLEAGEKRGKVEEDLELAKSNLSQAEAALKTAEGNLAKLTKGTPEHAKLEAEVASLRAEVEKHKVLVSSKSTELAAAEKSFLEANAAYANPGKVAPSTEANLVLNPNADQSNPGAVNAEVAKTEAGKTESEKSEVAPVAIKDPMAGQVIVGETPKTEVPKDDVPKTEKTELPAPVAVKADGSVKTETPVKTEGSVREVKTEVLEVGSVSVKTLDGKSSSLKDVAAGNFKNRINACVRDAQDSLAPYLATQSHKDAQLEIRVAEIPAAADISGALAKLDYTMPIAAEAEAYKKAEAVNTILFKEGKGSQPGKILVELSVTSQGEQVCKTLLQDDLLAKLGKPGESKKSEEQQIAKEVIAKVDSVNSLVTKTGEQSDASRNVASNGDASINSSRTKLNLALCKEMGCAKLEETPQGGYIFHMISDSAI